MDEGRFRADLFFRLNVFPIHVPPLRERRADIPALAHSFAIEFGKKSARRIERVDADDLTQLQQRRWPGNIRELRNVIERAMVVCEDRLVRVDDLPSLIVDFALAEPADRYGGPRTAEQRMIESALLRAGGNKARASAEIGWNRGKLYRRMKALGIGIGFGSGGGG